MFFKKRLSQKEIEKVIQNVIDQEINKGFGKADYSILTSLSAEIKNSPTYLTVQQVLGLSLHKKIEKLYLANRDFDAVLDILHDLLTIPNLDGYAELNDISINFAYGIEKVKSAFGKCQNMKEIEDSILKAPDPYIYSDAIQLAMSELATGYSLWDETKDVQLDLNSVDNPLFSERLLVISKFLLQALTLESICNLRKAIIYLALTIESDYASQIYETYMSVIYDKYFIPKDADGNELVTVDLIIADAILKSKGHKQDLDGHYKLFVDKYGYLNEMQKELELLKNVFNYYGVKPSL